jgi:hypothetical protein
MSAFKNKGKSNKEDKKLNDDDNDKDVVPEQDVLALVLQRIEELKIEKETNNNTTLTQVGNNKQEVADNKKALVKEMELSLDEKQRERARNKALVMAAMHEGNVGTKALAAQFYHKEEAVHDKTANAVRHHTGSHYVMAGGVQFQRG